MWNIVISHIEEDLWIFFLMPDLLWILFILMIIWLGFWDYKHREQPGYYYQIISFGCIAVALEILSILALPVEYNLSYYYDCFIINGVFLYARIFMFFSVGILLLLAYFSLRKEKIPVFEFVLLVFIAALGMSLLITANDLIIMFLAFELQNLCFYILIAILRKSNFGLEASLKFLMLAGLSSGIFVLGISFVYGHFGTTNCCLLIELIKGIEFSKSTLLFHIGILLLFIGVIFKLGLVPFHYWIADIYEGSPLIVTVFLSVSSKIAVVALILKLVYFFGTIINIIIFLKIISLLSIFFGTIITLYQTKILRLLAYGGIVHFGYISLSICYIEERGIDALVSSLNYLLIYVILSLTVFSILVYLNNLLIDKKGRGLDYISDFGEIKNSALSFILVLSFLSMAGIPPFAGFFAKFYIFMLMAQSGDYVSLFLVSILSIISCVYYLRLVSYIFFDKTFLYQLWNLMKSEDFMFIIINIIIIFFF